MAVQQTILDKILAHKQTEVIERKSQVDISCLKQRAAECTTTRDFVGALSHKTSQQQAAVIAEVKKASPSKGVIKADFNHIKTALDYEAHGAACISVLTDEAFFQGHDHYLQAIKQQVQLPLLRKDFIIDEYQIYESRVLGADCILLIVAALSDQQLQDYCQLARALNLAVLVESHNQDELYQALQLPTPLIGINNRDLKTFHTSLETTLQLLPHIPTDKLVITESGISSQQDIMKMMHKGVYGFLIGESLMRGELILKC